MSKVYYDPNGESGNIFYIMGMATRELEKEGRHFDAMVMRNQVTECHSYENALLTIAEYVDLIEKGGDD